MNEKKTKSTQTENKMKMNILFFYIKVFKIGEKVLKKQ